jgi:hypothetical protein
VFVGGRFVAMEMVGVFKRSRSVFEWYLVRFLAGFQALLIEIFHCFPQYVPNSGVVS